MRQALLLLTFAAAVLPAQTPPAVLAGNIRTYKVPSASLGAERSVNVLLPTDYATSTSRYPTLYLLHGLGDDHTTWSVRTNLSLYATRYKLIVVMPDGGRSWYANSASDSKAKFEDYIVRDVVNWADSTFRTIPLARARAIAGLSMGGYGAAMIGLKHFNRFAAVGIFSGAVGRSHDFPKPPDNAPPARNAAEMQAIMGAPGSPERAAHDPFLLIDKIPYAKLPLIYIAVGGQDFLLAENHAFVQLLAEKKIPYEYREISPRVHEWDFWDEQIQVFLRKLDRLTGFAVH